MRSFALASVTLLGQAPGAERWTTMSRDTKTVPPGASAVALRRHTALTAMVPVGDFRDQSPAVVALHRYAKVCGLRPLCGRACHHGKGQPAGERAGQAGRLYRLVGLGPDTHLIPDRMHPSLPEPQEK
jgi:hypothetical protein